MRRGLLKWSKEEVPEDVLQARLERLRGAMAKEGLRCVAIYTNFPRPAAVSYLTHFVPYWSQGVLLVFADRAPELIVSLSKRVGPWIAETARVAGTTHTPDPGSKAAELIADACPGIDKVGVVELGSLPGGIGTPLAAGLPGVALVDASDLFTAIRYPADEAELTLTARGAALADEALAKALAAKAETAEAYGRIAEEHCRLAGAEELSIRFAPDLAADPLLRRVEGEVKLGDRFALQLSMAWRGHWVRVGRSAVRDGAIPAEWDAAERWFDGIAGRLTQGTDPAAAFAGLPDGATLADWSIEQCRGTRPLEVIAGSALPNGPGPVPGGVIVVSARLDFADGSWLRSDAFRMASESEATQRLAAA